MANANNVSVGKPKLAGAVSRAPLGTSLPVSANVSLDAAFQNLGYISEDGLTNENSPETEEIKAWGGDTVATPLSQKTDTFTYKLIESLNVEVLKAVYGEDNVEGDIDTGITVRSNADEVEGSVWVIDMILSGDTLKRIVIPNGKITELGEITYQDGEAIGYETTITAMPYAEWDNDNHREFIVSAQDTQDTESGE